jgi:hypothetical protein
MPRREHPFPHSLASLASLARNTLRVAAISMGLPSHSRATRLTGILTATRLYGKLVKMKTTIDIPESLYRQAKIHAVETGRSLKDLVIASLRREIRTDGAKAHEPVAGYFSSRKLLPGYKALLKRGAFKGGTDSTQIVSEDRDA